MIQVSNIIKRAVFATLAISVVINVVLVNTASASVKPTRAEAATKNEKNTFCSELANISTHIDSQITDRTKTFKTVKDTRGDNLSDKFASRDQKLSDNRAKWDKNRQDHYAKLSEKASIDTQKQAVEQFKSTVDNAIAKRRSIVDSAVAVYQKTIETRVTGQQSNIDSIVMSYQVAVDAAQTKAQASCSAGTNSLAVREAFRSDLLAARNNLQSGKNGVDTIKTTVEAAAKARSDAIATAISEFHSTLDQAQDALKAALKQ